MKAIVYTRYSPRRVRRDGKGDAVECESCETQMAYCERLAEKKGYEIVGMFEDRLMSGKDEDRPGLWAAVDAIPKNGILLVWKLDRLARDVYLSEVIKRSVRKAGGRIEAVSGDVEGEGPEAVMIRQVLASFAEYERKITAIRTRYAMIQHQHSGRRMSNHTPYGWRRDPADPARMIPHEREREAVQHVKDLRVTGVGFSEIAHRLNDEMRDCARTGAWNPKTVRKIANRL